VSFSLIGFAVFAAGLGVQVLLVQVAHVPAVLAYVTQLVLSVQANFLANYHWTWGDRNAPFWRSYWRYDVKRAAGTVLSLSIYPVLVRLGMNYLVANALLVAVLTPANYVLGHFWTFSVGRGQAPAREAAETPAPEYVARVCPGKDDPGRASAGWPVRLSG
jgi:putative flippase GtrA